MDILIHISRISNKNYFENAELKELVEQVNHCHQIEHSSNRLQVIQATLHLKKHPHLRSLLHQHTLLLLHHLHTGLILH